MKPHKRFTLFIALVLTAVFSVSHITNNEKDLSYINVQPYYAYVHDLTGGTEDMRTSLQT